MPTRGRTGSGGIVDVQQGSAGHNQKQRSTRRSSGPRSRSDERVVCDVCCAIVACDQARFPFYCCSPEHGSKLKLIVSLLQVEFKSRYTIRTETQTGQVERGAEQNIRERYASRTRFTISSLRGRNRTRNRTHSREDAGSSRPDGFYNTTNERLPTCHHTNLQGPQFGQCFGQVLPARNEQQTKHPDGGADFPLRGISRPNNHSTKRLRAVKLGSMQKDFAMVVLKKKELAELERMLEAKSWKLHRAHSQVRDRGRRSAYQ